MTREEKLALDLLRESPQYAEDARVGAPVGNSVIGSLLSIQHGVPRQVAEQAVLRALDALAAEQRKAAPSHRLKRSGQAPLAFQGELLAEADGQMVSGKDQNRWHEVSVYRTEGGKYVAAVAYRTRWQGELDRDFAEVVGQAEAVAAVLREYSPTEYVQGYPAGDAYAERQARLFRDLRQRYDALVTEVLESDEDFTEQVD